MPGSLAVLYRKKQNGGKKEKTIGRYNKRGLVDPE
jgi:hypothetical protein